VPEPDGIGRDAMTLHRTTGRWKYGLGLALVTTLMWGLLPVALKSLLAVLDPWTVTWYRLSLAAAVLAAFVIPRHGLTPFRRLGSSGIILLVIAVSGLCANYIAYILGLDRISPGTAQVVIQLAPMFLLLGSLWVFRERFSAVQWAGAAVFTAGLFFFFNRRLEEIFTSIGSYTLGVLGVVAAAVTWAGYALAQKQLLRKMPSSLIMLVVYLGGTAVFLPFSHPEKVTELDGVYLGLLAFGALNTLVAYGCFAEALNHWEASRVSAALTTVPLVTLAAVEAGAVWFPAYVTSEDLNLWSVVGAGMVVAGAMAASLFRPSKDSEGPAAAPEARNPRLDEDGPAPRE
jgi:drug/metabolite transporter (DMT)-like permease